MAPAVISATPYYSRRVSAAATLMRAAAIDALMLRYFALIAAHAAVARIAIRRHASAAYDSCRRHAASAPRLFRL